MILTTCIIIIIIIEKKSPLRATCPFAFVCGGSLRLSYLYGYTLHVIVIVLLLAQNLNSQEAAGENQKAV